MPTDSNSLTECWVGLVFNSPAVGIYGSNVQWMNMALSGPYLIAELPDRLQEGQTFDIADGTADFAQDKICRHPNPNR